MRDERGRETFGRFPRALFDYADGAPLAFINRRGRDGEDPAAAAAEIRLVADALRSGVTAVEVERAAQLVARRLRLPPFGAAPTRGGVSPRGLYVPASTLVMAELLGWPADLEDRVRAVSLQQVAASLQRALAPSSSAWFELVPLE